MENRKLNKEKKNKTNYGWTNGHSFRTNDVQREKKRLRKRKNYIKPKKITKPLHKYLYIYI